LKRKFRKDTDFNKDQNRLKVSYSHYILFFLAATNLNTVRTKTQNCEEYNRINALSVFVVKTEREEQEKALPEHVDKPKGKLASFSGTK